MRRCKPLGSLHSFLSYAPQLSGANPVSYFTLLLAFPQLLSNHRGGGSILWIAVWGALIHIWRPEIADGCNISCLLIWQSFTDWTPKKYPNKSESDGSQLLVFCITISHLFFFFKKTFNQMFIDNLLNPG